MAEETNKGDGENLNSEGQENDQANAEAIAKAEAEKQDQKTTYTKEEVDAIMKKHQADSERGVQKVFQEKQFQEKIVDAIQEISDDKKHLIVLHESDPKVAKAILDKFYGGQSIEEFMKDQGLEEALNDPEIVNKRIKSEAQKLANEERISDKKNEFIAKLKMSEEEKTQFETAFEERKQLKSFSMDDIQKHFEKAYREVNDWFDAKKYQETELIAKATASGGGKWSGGESTHAVSATKKSVDDFFDKFMPNRS